jgi:hypothetical protein
MGMVTGGNNVTWEKTGQMIPPPGTYTIILRNPDTNTFVKATGVVIGSGPSGSVDYSEFAGFPYT